MLKTLQETTMLKLQHYSEENQMEKTYQLKSHYQTLKFNLTSHSQWLGDPSTFTFTMDAFPGYTAFDKTKKVLCNR